MEGDYKKLIADACERIEEDIAPIDIDLEGAYDAAKKILTITGKAVDCLEIMEKYLDIFYDIFYYLTIDTDGVKYRFEFFTYIDDSFDEDLIEHDILLETDMSLLPDTGGITRDDWEKYVNQLVYKVDGQKENLEPPDMFYEEEEEGEE